MHSALPGFLLALVAAGVGLASAAAERVLLDPQQGLDANRVKGTDAEVALRGTGPTTAIRVVAGTRAPWPGLALEAPDGTWDLEPFAAVDIELNNPGSAPVKVFGRIDNAGADGTDHCVTAEASLPAGRTGALRIPLKRASDGRLGGKLFGLRGYPLATGGPGTVDPARVTQIVIFVARPAASLAFEVRSVKAVGTYVRPTAWVTDADPFLPFIDTFGQYRHRDWPGKTKGTADLAERRAAEERDLAERPGPADWTKYGGWAAGPQLEATAFFRVQKYEGRWWFVDPEGRLFWSHGVDCVRLLDATPIDEREDWFVAFPGAQAEFSEFLVERAVALKGHYAGRSPRSFSFAGANLRRKYGEDWRTAYPEVVHRRLRSWGLNTIGNWSDNSVALLRRTPYTDSLHSRGVRVIEGSEGYWGKFPDVFAPAFAEGLRREMSGKIGRSAGDPWCLGYFSDNEMAWGDEVSLAEAALRSPPEQPAKRVLVADLQGKYRTVEKLNAAWGTAHADWDAFLAAREVPDRSRARPDLEAFSTRVAEEYFRTVRDAIREVAPKQLYLGCRFAWVNPRAAAAAAKFCDVVSYNLYRRSVADFEFNGGADVPLLIGEFHFGALDRGMFHTGLVPVADQAARGQAYREYVEGALRHPQFVGTHWFQWQDEPTTGRVYDEENYQIGLVDVADTPYAETIAAIRAVGEDLYRLRLGRSPAK